MSEQLVGEMDQMDFERWIEAFVNRSADPDAALPAELVFAMLDNAELSKQALKVESAAGTPGTGGKPC